jgi:hypothetical protein
LECHAKEVALLSQLAGGSLHFTFRYHHIFGRAAHVALALQEMVQHRAVNADIHIVEATPWASHLKAGRYAVSVTAELETMCWQSAVLVTVTTEALGNIACVHMLTDDPGGDKINISVHPSAWSALAAAAQDDAAEAVTSACAKKHVWTQGRQLLVCCVCQLKPHAGCVNSGLVDVLKLDGQHFDNPLAANESWPATAEAFGERFHHLNTALRGCIAAVVDSGLAASVDFCGAGEGRVSTSDTTDGTAQQTAGKPGVYAELANRWGPCNTARFLGKVSSAEQKIGKVVTAWLKEELLQHGVTEDEMKKQPRDRLVEHLRAKLASGAQRADATGVGVADVVV